jgi:transcriptional regulator with XRE-family HTH domain
MAPETELGAALARARERAGFSQEEVALLVGQSRPVVSYWESGARTPNSLQLSKLASIYRIALDELLRGADRARPEFERLLFRDAGDRLDPAGKYEIQRFLAFLDAYADLLEVFDEPPGMTNPPFAWREGFRSQRDIRRKAEEVRSYLRLGTGPVGDLAGLADLIGVTVYFAPLGEDLEGTVSGAFLPHDRVGFSILVNAQTTRGRQQFTLAHELAHAFLDGDVVYVGYYGRREAAERFASAFAAEFLVPTEGLRAAAEGLGVTGVKDAEVVVHLQRLFRVSYAMMLHRLLAADLASHDDVERLRDVQPVHLAERLGYTIAPDEWHQDPDRWRLGRFPPRFLRLMRRAFQEERMSVAGAALVTGLAAEDIEEFLSDLPQADGEPDEFDYFRASA